MSRSVFSLLVVILLLTACAAPAAAGPKISVENAWARPAAVGSMSATPDTQGMSDMSGMSASGTNSAAYFVIVNNGDEADTLIGASSDVASNTEMHETRIQNDVAEMVPIPRLDIPAHGQVEFKPQGYHVMLIGLNHDLNEGDTLKISLQFEKSGTITLDVPVRQGN
jgi:periplasmic copper chaperone A